MLHDGIQSCSGILGISFGMQTILRGTRGPNFNALRAILELQKSMPSIQVSARFWDLIFFSSQASVESVQGLRLLSSCVGVDVGLKVLLAI